MSLKKSFTTMGALVLFTGLSVSAHATPEYRLAFHDQANAIADVLNFYNVAAGPTSTGTLTFDGYTFSVNLNSNYPGTATLGTLSQSFTFSGSLAGANHNFVSNLTIVDSSNVGTPVRYTLPNIAGGSYQLVSDGANTSNASISGGQTQTYAQANAATATNAANPFIGGGNAQTATVPIAPDPLGYTMGTNIVFSGIIANGSAGLSSITASSTSSVQSIPPTGVQEPASLVLLGAELLGTGLLRRRAK